jgi:hypothetical protein
MKRNTMIIKGNVLSVERDKKKGFTTLKIVTRELEDHISWCGKEIQMKATEYEHVEIEEELK